MVEQTESLRILVIAPAAPPKNSPEAMQVGRFVTELAKRHSVALITTPVETGWVRSDPSLRELVLGAETRIVSLPFHKVSKRLVGSRYLSLLHVPDADFWLATQAGKVARTLHGRYDLIYSRSFPLSAALLARALKRRLGIPWVMHLSDPWAGGPYRFMGGVRGLIDQRLERKCVIESDRVTVTTEAFRSHYMSRYPAFARKISVCPNVMPDLTPKGSSSPRLEPEENVHVVHTGAFYGMRRPTPVLEGFRRLAQVQPKKARRLIFWFVGNCSDSVAAEIAACPGLRFRLTGPLGYAETRLLQERADVLLSIEPADDHPLLKAVLLSKLVDYLAVRKPILALTPAGSVSDKWMRRGYGWSVEPSRLDAVADVLGCIADQGWTDPLPEPPAELSAEYNVNPLEAVFNSLVLGSLRS